MSIRQINEFRSQLPKIFLDQVDLKPYYKDTTSPSYISELVSVDKNSCTDFSPLCFALLIGNVEFVQGVMLQLTRYLLQSQKPLLTPGYSPMLFQLGSVYKKVVNDILTNRFNSSGYSPLDIAVIFNNPMLVNCILNYPGFDVKRELETRIDDSSFALSVYNNSFAAFKAFLNNEKVQCVDLTKVEIQEQPLLDLLFYSTEKLHPLFEDAHYLYYGSDAFVGYRDFIFSLLKSRFCNDNPGLVLAIFFYVCQKGDLGMVHYMFNYELVFKKHIAFFCSQLCVEIEDFVMKYKEQITYVDDYFTRQLGVITYLLKEIKMPRPFVSPVNGTLLSALCQGEIDPQSLSEKIVSFFADQFQSDLSSNCDY